MPDVIAGRESIELAVSPAFVEAETYFLTFRSGIVQLAHVVCLRPIAERDKSDDWELTLTAGVRLRITADERDRFVRFIECRLPPAALNARAGA